MDSYMRTSIYSAVCGLTHRSSSGTSMPSVAAAPSWCFLTFLNKLAKALIIGGKIDLIRGYLLLHQS